MEHSDTPEPTASPKQEKAEKPAPVAQQFANSAVAEMAAFAVAIGAVYASERLMPNQTKAFVSRLAEQLGRWRGVDTETQRILAKKIVDVGIMNLSGVASLGTQFALRRAQQSEDDKTPLLYEVGRLAAGRLAGTTTALGTLALLETHSPQAMKQTERAISNILGASEKADRFAGLALSNAVQSLGAIAGNSPAQLLYDHLVNPSAKSAQK